MFRRSSTTAALSAVLIAALTLTGCGSSSNSASSSKSMTDVTFLLNWLPNVEFSGLWVAQQQGWWKDAGIRMHYKGWAPGLAPETDVPARGGNTFGFQSGAAIVIAASKKVPIQAIYSDTQNSVFGLTTMTKSGITHLSQLRGKRVGYQSHESYVPATMLSCAGLKPTEWKPVEVGFDPSVLTTGQVDAYLTFLNNEPIALKMRGLDVYSIAAKDHCFHFYDDVMFTTKGLIAKNPDLVKKVTQIVAKGFRWAHQNPNPTAKLTVQTYFPASAAGKGVAADQNLKQQTLELKAFEQFSKSSNGQYTGLMDTATWRDSIDTLAKYAEIKSKPDPSAIYTNQFNPYK